MRHLLRSILPAHASLLAQASPLAQASFLVRAAACVAIVGASACQDPGKVAGPDASAGVDAPQPDVQSLDGPPADAAVPTDTLAVDATADTEDAAAPVDTTEPVDIPGVADVVVTPVDVKADTGTPIKDEYKELLVKVLNPSGREWVQNEGNLVSLSGVAYGAPDKIEWKTSDGKSGKITPEIFWKTSPPLEMAIGDNLITVTATKGDKVVTDTMHVTYNPFFSFEGAPEVAPNVLFVGENNKLVVHMPLAAASAGAGGTNVVEPSSIALIEVDENGKEINKLASLVDNGQGGSCDDVQKDSVFSNCLTLNAPKAKTMYFRVKAMVDVPGKKYEALSPVTVVDVVDRFKKDECTAIVSLQKKVKGDYLEALKTKDMTVARDAAVLAVQADPTVAEAGVSSGNGYSVWIRYKTGRIGALNLAPAGMRAGSSGSSGNSGSAGNSGSGGPDVGAALPTHSVGTRRALALAPFASEFNQGECVAKGECDPGCPAGTVCTAAKKCVPVSVVACEKSCGEGQACILAAGDEAEQAGQELKKKQCPPFAVDLMTGSQAFLRWYREMSTYGVVAVTGHGDVLFETMDIQAKKDLGWEHLGAQEVIWSGEPVNCAALSSQTAGCNKQGGGCPTGETCVKTDLSGGKCVDHTQGDIMKGRVVIGDETYGLLPSFVQRHAVEPFPASVVYLGSCRSMYNGSLSVQLYGNGAAAVVGFSDYVSNSFAYEQGWKLFDGLVNKGQSVNQSLSAVDADPKHKGRTRMLGNSKANTSESGLINPSWDVGKLTGWKQVGDGRVISRLGVTIPVAGKFMAIISTGLGFTAQNGSLEQPFCIGPDKKEMCFFWKFYSEEFLEYCGSSYMDRFTATLSADAGKKTLTDVFIDQLCPYDCGPDLEFGPPSKNTCSGPGASDCKCGQQWKTLSPSDLIFDQGGVYMTPWQKACTEVTGFAGTGKKVDLKFFATDVGDSIFDSAILIDEVTVH